MKIVNLWKLVEFKQKNANARVACVNWENVTRLAEWDKFMDVQKSFNSVDLYKGQYIFDLGKQYRLIATINFSTKQLVIREIMKHDKYDKGNWKK